jgi:hypothetical protein
VTFRLKLASEAAHVLDLIRLEQASGSATSWRRVKVRTTRRG